MVKYTNHPTVKLEGMSVVFVRRLIAQRVFGMK